jgi:hypothetical protein
MIDRLHTLAEYGTPARKAVRGHRCEAAYRHDAHILKQPGMFTARDEWRVSFFDDGRWNTIPDIRHCPYCGARLD